MIDWNKRNGGFLSPESVYEDQLGNLSQQINEKDKEIKRLNNIINEYDIFLKNELSFEGHSVEWIENKLKELKGEQNEKEIKTETVV